MPSASTSAHILCIWQVDAVVRVRLLYVRRERAAGDGGLLIRPSQTFVSISLIISSLPELGWPIDRRAASRIIKITVETHLINLNFPPYLLGVMDFTCSSVLHPHGSRIGFFLSPTQ